MSCLKMLEKRTTERTAGFGVRFREFPDGLISLSCQFSIGREELRMGAVLGVFSAGRSLH
jgi:hypothetical protein